MLKMRRRISLAVWCAFFSCGCAAKPTSATPDEAVTWPSFWPQPAAPLLPDSECPEIAGLYIANGRSWSRTVDKHERSQSEGETVSAWILRSHPRSREAWRQKSNPTQQQRIALAADLEKLAGKFLIAQPTSESFEVTLLSDHKDFVDTIDYDQQKGDFRCENGFVIFRTTDSGEGSSEGVSHRIFIESRLTRARDGSLLYHEKVKNHWSQLFFFSGVRITDTFFWFQGWEKASE